MLKQTTYVMRNGYDGEKCFVHARCCANGDFMIATAQYLDVSGSDLFSGIYMSKSFDGGKTWSELVPQEGLKPIIDGDVTIVGCDATPMYHKKTGKILLMGHTASYTAGGKSPASEKPRYTFYSVYDEEKDCFTKMKFLDMPEKYIRCGNGCGQSVEMENGDVLIPVYYKTAGTPIMTSMALKCSFDGENLCLLETGNEISVPIKRGAYEPSLTQHKGTYYATYRNDECAFVAKSEDGLHYTDFQLWKWQDGSILQNYNTQQHWMVMGDDLYLVYTRRGADNDHVFRHRAPLFMAKVENMRLVKESEQICVTERGARLGNFGVTQVNENKAVIMAAEWMQPIGCEKYGSDNSIFVNIVEG